MHHNNHDYDHVQVDDNMDAVVFYLLDVMFHDYLVVESMLGLTGMRIMRTNYQLNAIKMCLQPIERPSIGIWHLLHITNANKITVKAIK